MADSTTITRPFRPIGARDRSQYRSVVARVPTEMHDRLRAAAKAHGCTLQEFAEQALEYALRELAKEPIKD